MIELYTSVSVPFKTEQTLEAIFLIFDTSKINKLMDKYQDEKSRVNKATEIHIIRIFSTLFFCLKKNKQKTAYA